MSSCPGLFTFGFNPLSISGCALWVKADSLVLNDGDPVSPWTDLSPNLKNLTASGTERPTYKTAIQNGLPIVRFNGTSNIMNNVLFSLSQPTTVLMVVKQTSKTTSGRFIDGGNGSANRQIVDFGITTGFFSIYAGVSPAADSTDHSGAFHVVTAIFNGTSSFGYIDGAVIHNGVNAGTQGMNPIKVGGDNTATFMTGDIGELLYYNSALSGTNRGNVEAYLKSKWGTP